MEQQSVDRAPRNFMGVTEGWLTLGRLDVLKRQSVIFDQIGVLWLQDFIESMYTSLYGERDHAQELERLRDAGILFEPTFTNGPADAHPQMQQYLQQAYWIGQCADDLKLKLGAPRGLFLEYEKAATRPSWHRYLLSVVTQRGPRQRSPAEELASLGWQGKDLAVLGMALSLRLEKSADAVPVLPATALDLFCGQEHHVVRIVLNALPRPSASVSWEQVFEFRRDADARRKFFALRNWMSEVGRSSLKPVEILQKLEWLLAEYEAHMQLHKLMISPGPFETLVVAGTEFIENLVKFRWSASAKQLFLLKHQRLKLLEEEAKAPGREVAFIVDAQSRHQERAS
jgi:hypothetical protein